jgi:Tfp pilus assembly protein FimT
VSTGASLSERMARRRNRKAMRRLAQDLELARVRSIAQATKPRGSNAPKGGVSVCGWFGMAGAYHRKRARQRGGRLRRCNAPFAGASLA